MLTAAFLLILYYFAIFWLANIENKLNFFKIKIVEQRKEKKII